MAVLSEADFFGEAACLMNRPQQASVFAQTECTLYALDRQALNAVLGRDAEVFDQLRTLADQRFNLFADTAVQATWGMLLGEATVVGLYSPKGGSGGTCLALNLVGRLSRLYPGQVLLLDLDFPYSHAALLAGLVPTSCLARLAEVPPDSFEEVLLSTILYHRGGPMILPGALRPEESDLVTAELIARAIGILRKTFRRLHTCCARPYATRRPGRRAGAVGSEERGRRNRNPAEAGHSGRPPDGCAEQPHGKTRCVEARRGANAQAQR